MKYTFEKYGKPTYFIDRFIYRYPLHMAVKFNIPLLICGENVGYEYGGSDAVETYSAKSQINNGVGSGIPTEELYDLGISPPKGSNFFEALSLLTIDKLEAILLSGIVLKIMN